jgi:hypothetical protein
MKRLIVPFLVLASIHLFAQDSNNQVVVIKGGSIQNMTIKSKQAKTEGSCYYSENWFKGSIKLFSGEEIQSYPLKYDMKMNQIDIKVNNTVKVVSIGAVKEVIWMTDKGKSELLRNVSEYDGISGYGFFSVITEGKFSLLKKTELMVMESNYNAAMDVGSKNKRYVKKSKYYIQHNTKLTEVKAKKKKILKKFKEKSEQVEEYAEANNLKFNDDNDLKLIFEYYNNL